jgi:hypothetical protein
MYYELTSTKEKKLWLYFCYSMYIEICLTHMDQRGVTFENELELPRI